MEERRGGRGGRWVCASAWLIPHAPQFLQWVVCKASCLFVAGVGKRQQQNKSSSSIDLTCDYVGSHHEETNARWNSCEKTINDPFRSNERNERATHLDEGVEDGVIVDPARVSERGAVRRSLSVRIDRKATVTF